MSLVAALTGLNWGIPFYLLGLYGVVCFFTRPQDNTKPGRIAWSPLEAASVTLAIYFVSQLVGAALVYIYPLAHGWNQQQITNWFNQNVNGQFFLVLAVEALTLALLWCFLKRRKADFKTIGLKRRPQWRDLGYVLLGFGVYFALYVVAVSIVQHLVHINVDQQQQLGFDGAHGGELVPVFISLVLLPPIAEEILVRGFLYSGLKKGLPKIWAVLLTSGLFAMAHLEAGSGAPLLWIAAIDTFVLSLVLIYLREKTGSLWASIGLHMLKNGVAFLSLFVFKVM